MKKLFFVVIFVMISFLIHAEKDMQIKNIYKEFHAISILDENVVDNIVLNGDVIKYLGKIKIDPFSGQMIFDFIDPLSVDYENRIKNQFGEYVKKGLRYSIFTEKKPVNLTEEERLYPPTKWNGNKWQRITTAKYNTKFFWREFSKSYFYLDQVYDGKIAYFYKLKFIESKIGERYYKNKWTVEQKPLELGCAIYRNRETIRYQKKKRIDINDTTISLGLVKCQGDVQIDI